uniref:Uncharacterized protein n=1 Tax=Branchiostoma floridae TaxID=7739 RepID=C3YYM9_BRAFL|eukprot:XP_002598657.1 hypothetical protein BRAFLDRAFT_67058 [Branchiostoma floridae]
MGFGLTRPFAGSALVKILRGLGRKIPFNGLPSSKFWRKFERKHPELTLRKTDPLSLARARYTTPQAVNNFFDMYEAQLEKLGLQNRPDRIYNVYESSMVLDPQNEKVYAQKGSDLNRCENRAHLTSSVEEDVTNDADSVDETPSAKDLDGPTDSAPNIPVGASASAPVPGQSDKTTEKEKGFCGFEPGFLMPKFANTEDASEGSETPSDLAGQDKPVVSSLP